MNCLANPATVAVLEVDFTVESMRAAGACERVYSAFDGRIYGTIDGDVLRFHAYSWGQNRPCADLQEAIRWLLKEARSRAEYFESLKKPQGTHVV